MKQKLPIIDAETFDFVSEDIYTWWTLLVPFELTGGGGGIFLVLLEIKNVYSNTTDKAYCECDR